MCKHNVLFLMWHVSLYTYFNPVVAVVNYDGGYSAKAFPQNLWTGLTSPYFLSIFSTKYF
jgi:hypothetical protein